MRVVYDENIIKYDMRPVQDIDEQDIHTSLALCIRNFIGFNRHGNGKINGNDDICSDCAT